ncbi:MAG: hypothetical protein M3032_13550 [Verrucomicrobiota bacterium]|nr:hypothetical protein [Verrucomicrobiota bacterium]
MSIRIVLSLCAVALVALAARADDELPKPQAFARYDAMTNRSPFAVATAVAPPPQAPNFAKDLYIANAAKLSDEGVVTLSSNVDKNMKEYLSTKAPNKSGYSISNIEWSDRVGATKVTISKDGQFATLSFNQALLSQPVATGGQAPQQPQPQPQIVNGINGANPIPTPIATYPAGSNAVPVQPAGGAFPAPARAVPAIPAPVGTPAANAIKPAPVPMLPTPPPRVRGVIQRNPNGIAQPVADDRAQLQQQDE